MSHRRAPRFAALAAAVSSGLLTAALAAGPAFADAPGGTAGAGCSGQSCWVWMQSQYIHLSGSYTSSPTRTVPVPPPPCWMTPLAGGAQMYQLYLQSRGQQVGPNGINPWADYKQWIPQIIKNRNSPGMWYMPEMLTTSAGLACGGSLPLLYWAAPGTAPPAPPIPPATLAAYAYDHFKIPSPALVVNPAGRNYVSLPSYVWAVPANGGARMPASLWITASSGNNSVTLTATTSQLYLTDSSATVYSPCPATGSRFPLGHAPGNSGPGTRPDCGLVFTAPSTANTIGASLTYQIKVTGAQVGFNPITVTGQKTVSVAEIQNLNG